MKLEQIGFYTLSDRRAATASETSPLSRCELLLTDRCNFRCPYCRRIGGPDMEYGQAARTVRLWSLEGLKAIRFSGGEPTLHPWLPKLVRLARESGVERVAVSTNGSARWAVYEGLLAAGADDFSVSLDACCAEDGDRMAGGVKGAWERVVANVRRLSARAYTTVGVVLTPDNAAAVEGIVRFADGLGVSDIRVIPAAQAGDRLCRVDVDAALLDRHPILRYRAGNIAEGRPVRGLGEGDPDRCGLAMDDMAVMGDDHYPCIIYLREGGKPIGKVDYGMRAERARWSGEHDTHADPICRRNCLDVCVDYNRKYASRSSNRACSTG